MSERTSRRTTERLTDDTVPLECPTCGMSHHGFSLTLAMNRAGDFEPVPALVLACGSCDRPVQVWLDDTADEMLRALLTRVIYPPMKAGPSATEQPLDPSED